MQLYIIAPLIVYSIQRYKLKAVLVCLLMILICIGSNVTSYVTHDLNDLMEDLYVNLVHDTPVTLINLKIHKLFFVAIHFSQYMWLLTIVIRHG